MYIAFFMARDERGGGGGVTATGDRSARIMMLALLILSLILIWMIVRPFAGALFMAVVLAVTFHPLYQRLSKKLHGHRTTAAAIITICLVLALVLPVVGLGWIAVREAAQSFDYFHQVLAEEGVDGLIRQIPPPIQGWVAQIWGQMPRSDQNAGFIYDLERRGAALIPRLLNGAGQALGQSALMVVALFFMLLDGAMLVKWVNMISPLRQRQMRELFTEFRRVSTTVLLGSVVTAGAQAVVALVGYLIARAPNPYFLALATFFLGLIPILGAGGFSFAIAVFLWLTGHIMPAIFLAIWSVLVVGMVDNILKPIVIRGGMETHGAIVFFALLGGFAAFGPVGLVLGPLSISLLLAVLRIYQRDFAEPDAAAASS